jgi:transaldolase/glucose-6-phosphate isomerase
MNSAEAMARRCATDREESTALYLGVILGELANNGRDKPTLMAPAPLAGFGAWLEQLVAESIGKQGKGIIPIDGEKPGPPGVYGDDRVFVHLRCAVCPDPVLDAQAAELARAGQPVVRIDWPDRHALGAEFYRWEFATAAMGAVVGVNPFDQPDVEESKVVTRRLAADYERTGKLPDEAPLIEAQGMAIYADNANPPGARGQREHRRPAQGVSSTAARGRLFRPARLHRNERRAPGLAAGDSERGARPRQEWPRAWGSARGSSTRQVRQYKGGPNTGVFLQITGDDPEDLPVPGQRYSFGTIKLAQARGDFEVLSARGPTPAPRAPQRRHSRP